MAIRFDNGTIRKAFVTPEGYLLAEAVFARDGVLEYRTPTGAIRKELRLPEENKKAVTSFGSVPFTVEHPAELLDSENALKYTKGLTDATVVYDKGGFVKGVITVFDSAAVESIRAGQTVEISAGYQCDVVEEPGVWNGERYDAIQRNIKVNHVCATRKGRAGTDVRILHLDSAVDDIAVEVGNSDWIAKLDSQSLTKSSPLPSKKMAKVTLDSVEYSDIPESFASVFSQKMNLINELTNRVDSLTQETSEIPYLKEQLKQAADERDRQMGRADAYEEIVNAAVPVLEAQGYYWDSDEQTFREDGGGKGKKKMPFIDEEEMDEEMSEEEDWEEEEEEVKPKKSKKKKDSYHEDSVADLLIAWKEAESIAPDIKFDSELTCAGVRRLVVEKVTKKDFADKSDDYIASRYDAIKENLSERTDSSSPYVNELQTVLSTRRDGKKCRTDAAKSCSCSGSCNNAMSESDKRRADNYKKPIGMTRATKY